jgi:YD repeat-containing protein
MHRTTVKHLFLALVALCPAQWAIADNYAYDQLNRLTKVDYGGGKSITYTYDPAGNIASIVKVGTSSLLAQTIVFGTPPSVAAGGTGTVRATASSGLNVTFSVTPGTGKCTLSGSTVGTSATVVGVAAGLCTVYADQNGNASYSPATQVSMTFSIALAAPSAPVITSTVSAPGRVTIYFDLPSSNGGTAIVGYTATCAATGQTSRNTTGAGPPLVVSGLTGGVSYACTLTASNGTYTSAASTPVSATPRSINLSPILMLLLD